MKQKQSLDIISSARPDRVPEEMRSIILAVGEISLWKSAGRLLHPSAYLTYAEFGDLSPELLATMAPDIVVSSLVSRSFDCLDLAQMLHLSLFKGRYWIIDPHVPNPRIILSEIHALCPGLDVMVVPLVKAAQAAH